MRIEIHPAAADDLRLLPVKLRRAAQDVLLDLLKDPIPAEAEPYAGIPGAYRLNTEMITVFYLVAEDVIDVRVIRANS